MATATESPRPEFAPSGLVSRLLGLLPGCVLRADTVEAIAAAALPPAAVALLAHHRHMTAVLEAHCGARVAVEVLARLHHGARYAREILLSLPDARVVQYATVDIALHRCPPGLRADIVGERLPLGRALLTMADELSVHPVGFVRVAVPPPLAARFGCPAGTPALGRLVRIRHAADVLIEGLELLAPSLA